MLCKQIRTNRIKVQTCKPQKIVNVFKNSYKNSIGMGIGDFLRGSFYLLNYCRDKNIEVDIDFSQHPIAKYLENIPTEDSVDYDNVMYYSPYVLTDLLKLIHSIENTNKILHVFTNPSQTHTIPDCDKHFMRNKFIPTKELQTAIDETLCRLNLIKKEYSVIHIRAGDQYLVEHNPLEQTLIEKIYNALARKISASSTYLLLTDSTELKKLLQHKYPKFIMEMKDIAHMHYQTENEQSLKNTMVDFFLIANAKSAIGLSVYGHITGFSMHCCAMNNIPYEGVVL